MTDILFLLFGEGDDLTALQMCLRAVVVFWIALLAVRISGRRSFGQRTAFDFIVAILLGAVMSRAVVGASEFLPTMAASFTLVLLHRLVAWLCVLSPRLDAWINGAERLLVRDGAPDAQQMRKGLISPRDLNEVARAHGKHRVGAHDCMVLERSGEISVVEKKSDGD